MPENFFSPAYRIETERLVIRCWNPQDAPSAAAVQSILNTCVFYALVNSEPTTLETKIERLRVFRAAFDRDENYTYAIFDREDRRVLGGTGLHPRVGAGAIEIGYWIHKDFIGQGLASETAAALTKVAFEIHQLRRVEIHCAPENVRSAAVPCKLGFTHEATLANAFRTRRNLNRYHDLVAVCRRLSADALCAGAFETYDMPAFMLKITRWNRQPERLQTKMDEQEPNQSQNTAGTNPAGIAITRSFVSRGRPGGKNQGAAARGKFAA
jgi:RimJ/RimL family protein N-acetyltransferase